MQILTFLSFFSAPNFLTLFLSNHLRCASDIFFYYESRIEDFVLILFNFGIGIVAKINVDRIDKFTERLSCTFNISFFLFHADPICAEFFNVMFVK